MELICPVKEYKWGKRGSKSLVAQLKQGGDPHFKIDEKETYAELWMGTHPNGPALIEDSRAPLATWLETKEDALGEAAVNVFGSKLPFLFKVLCADTPLSIQVHPNKEQAEQLHAKYPDIYKDPNAKPEIGIALTDFEALCGFRPIVEMQNFLELIPELTDLIGRGDVDNFINSSESEEKERLETVFSILMHVTDVDAKKHLDVFMKRVAGETPEYQDEVLFSLVTRIHKYFPGDVGCFCVYFLNYVVLKPNEAIFLEASEPHAYIGGDIIECSAGSDNVVRAGLTPKLRDVDTLCKVLNYTSTDGASHFLTPQTENVNSTLYKPPVQEFAVCKVEVGAGQSYNLKCRQTASIFIVVNGHGKMDDREIKKGKIFFLANGEVHTLTVPHTGETLVLFQAFINV